MTEGLKNVFYSLECSVEVKYLYNLCLLYCRSVLGVALQKWNYLLLTIIAYSLCSGVLWHTASGGIRTNNLNVFIQYSNYFRATQYHPIHMIK